MSTGHTVDSDVLVWERTNRTRGEGGEGNKGKGEGNKGKEEDGEGQRRTGKGKGGGESRRRSK